MFCGAIVAAQNCGGLRHDKLQVLLDVLENLVVILEVVKNRVKLT